MQPQDRKRPIEDSVHLSKFVDTRTLSGTNKTLFGFSHSGCDGIHDKVNDGRVDNQNMKFNTNEPAIQRGDDSSDDLCRFTVVWDDVVDNGCNVSDACRTDSGRGHNVNAKFVVNDLDDVGNAVCSTRGARNGGILGFVRTEVDAKDKHGPGSNDPVMLTILAPPIKWAAALAFVVKHLCSTLLKSLVEIRTRNT